MVPERRGLVKAYIHILTVADRSSFLGPTVIIVCQCLHIYYGFTRSKSHLDNR